MFKLPLTNAEIDSCRPVLADLYASVHSGDRVKRVDIAIVTYADRLPRPWPLGFSAALNHMPLILLGYGTPSKASAWQGPVGYNAPKVAAWFGLRRVVQLARAAQDSLGPAALRYLFFADGFDTLIVNAPQHFYTTAAASRLKRLASTVAPGGGVLSGECNCWPRCLKAAYLENTSAYAQCVQRSPSCFLNAGLAMGNSEGWEALLAALLPRLTPSEEEQLTLHKLYLEGKIAGWEIDEQSEILLSTLECVNPVRGKRPPKWSRCTTRPFAPLGRVSPAPHGGTNFLAESGVVQRPLVAHLQGSPTHSKAARFARFNHTFVAGWFAAAEQQPLLLVDSHAHGPCKATTLGALHAAL